MEEADCAETGGLKIKQVLRHHRTNDCRGSQHCKTGDVRFTGQNLDRFLRSVGFVSW